MDISITLKEAGLSADQASIYMAALELGQASMTDLAKKAKLKRPTAYLVVDELIKKGLISPTTQAKRRIYSAAHPQRLVEMIRLKEVHVESIIPHLTALYNKPSNKPKIQVYEGEAGVIALYKEFFTYMYNNEKEEALWFGNVDAMQKYCPIGVREYKRLIGKLDNPKIREIIYGEETSKKWPKKINRTGSNHQIRVIPDPHTFGFTDNVILGNKVALFSVNQDIFVTVIESEAIADTYRTMYELAWKSAKSTK